MLFNNNFYFIMLMYASRDSYFSSAIVVEVDVWQKLEVIFFIVAITVHVTQFRLWDSDDRLGSDLFSHLDCVVWMDKETSL